MPWWVGDGFSAIQLMAYSTCQSSSEKVLFQLMPAVADQTSAAETQEGEGSLEAPEEWQREMPI